MNGDNFFRLPHFIGHSSYFRWVLNSIDRDVFRVLCDMALTRGSIYYDEGIVIVNASLNSIARKAGLSYSTTKRSLNKLDLLGVAIAFKYSANRNISYFIGFRTDNNDRRYLVEHLIARHGEAITNAVDGFFSAKKKSQRNSVPKFDDYRLLCIAGKYRKLINENISDPKDLKFARIDNKNLYEALFGEKNEYQKPLQSDQINRFLLHQGRFPESNI